MSVFFFPVKRLEFWVHAEKSKSRSPFQAGNNSGHGKLRRSRHKHVYMIVQADLKMFDCKSFFFSNLVHQRLQVCFYIAVENFVSVLCSPYNVVIQIIHTSSTVCKLFVMSIHTNIITYSVSFINYRMQVKKRFISALKDRVSSLIFQKCLLYQMVLPLADHHRLSPDNTHRPVSEIHMFFPFCYLPVCMIQFLSM